MRAEDWPQFRGPGGTGVGEGKYPMSFDKPDNLRWKAKLPARGVSSPIIVADKVFITCSSGKRDDRLHVLAFDVKTGKELWHRQFAATGITAAHPKTCMAAPTPVADAKAVYAQFATGDIAALDHEGNLLWYRSLTGDYPTISNVVGMASSPVLYQDRLIVPMDNSGDSFVAALDTKNGKNIWKQSRPRESNWATPTIREITSQEVEVLFQNIKELAAYDMNTGEKKWAHNAPSQLLSVNLTDGLLMVPSGGLKMYRPSENNKLEEVWAAPKLQSGYSTPLVYDNHIYVANPAGVLNCADLKTGKTVWDERIRGSKQTFSSSPVAGDGKVYLVSEAGTLSVFKAGGTEAELLATHELEEEALATPALADGALFLRTGTTLYCFGTK
jgi:outer membrane protein assembly factor BamB